MQTAKRMERIPFSPIRKIFEAVNNREKQGEKITHLEIGRPDFDTPAHIKTAAKKALDEGKVHYVSNFGLPELRLAISRKLKSENNMTYDPEAEIIVTVGASEAIFAAMMALLDPGDEVLVPEPFFPNYLMCAHMAGAKPVGVPLRAENGYNPDVEDYKRLLTERTRMMIVTTPGNPTGTALTPEALSKLSRFACQHDLFVVADEIYEKMVYDDSHHLSIGSLPEMRDRTLTVNGFSKSYAMTGWRLGYVAAEAQLIAAVVRIHQYTVVCANSFGQWGALAALDGPQNCVAEMVSEFDRRRQMMIKRLSAMPRISFERPTGAFYIYIDTSGLGKSAHEIAQYLLDRAGVAVVAWDQSHIRISYANSYDNLAEAMDRMASALKKI
jgi:aminotransferase